jgi:hypothetical protein
MLIVRSFRVASIIIAYFNLEIKQFNIINIFINIERDSNRPIIVYKLPDGFKVQEYIIEVN